MAKEQKQETRTLELTQAEYVLLNYMTSATQQIPGFDAALNKAMAKDGYAYNDVMIGYLEKQGEVGHKHPSWCGDPNCIRK